jgi:predicted metalloendopeptidase
MVVSSSVPSKPDRDYYIKDDAKSLETRQKYQEHVEKMFELAGDKPDVAAAGAKTVLAVETGLPKAAMDRTERRDPKKRDHTMQATEIAAVAPGFQLTQYFTEIGAPKFTSLNLCSMSVLRWQHLISNAAITPMTGFICSHETQRVFRNAMSARRSSSDKSNPKG